MYILIEKTSEKWMTKGKALPCIYDSSYDAMDDMSNVAARMNTTYNDRHMIKIYESQEYGELVDIYNNEIIACWEVREIH